VKTHVVSEEEVHQAERALASAVRKVEEIGARLTAARSPLDFLRIQDEGALAQDGVRQAEARLREVREEHLRPIREERRERVRVAARQAVEAGEAFMEANSTLLREQLALMEVAGDAQPIWLSGFVPATPTQPSAFLDWQEALAKDGWL